MEELDTSTAAAPEVLHDEGDGATTPLQHKNPTVDAEPEAPKQAKSASEAIKAAMASMKDDKEAEEVPKVETKAKEIDAPEEEEAVDESEKEQDPKPKAAQSEGDAKGNVKIPSRLLPKEREVWANVPNAVKSAWERMEREHEEATSKYEPAVKFHDELKEFDQLAKQSGTTVKAALASFVNAENAIRQDFGRGIAQMAQAMGKNPTEAVAQFMRAAGVSPQQLGAYLQGQPATSVAQAQQRPQADPTAQAALQRVQQLEAQLAQQAKAQEIQRIESDFINPFKAANPRFEELQGPIAKLLNSDIIPTSMSPVERLETAYDMAVRLNPSPIAPVESTFAETVVSPTVGKSKSIGGAPGKSTVGSGKPKILSVKESIAAAMRSA